MGYLIETSGEINLRAIGEICLDGLVAEHRDGQMGRDYDKNKTLKIIRFPPQFIGKVGNCDCYSLGKFHVLVNGLLKEEYDVGAFKLNSPNDMANKLLCSLVAEHKIRPNWRLVIDNGRGNIPVSRQTEIGEAIGETSGINNLWLYWRDFKGYHLDAVKLAASSHL